MNVVYLLCGVPGSGKTWVCEKLKDKFHYIPHDFHSHENLVYLASGVTDQFILIDCPFAERKLRYLLEEEGIDVIPIFIVEHPDVVRERYFKREGRSPTHQILTRSVTIMNKVREWDAKFGTSQQIYDYLKEVT